MGAPGSGPVSHPGSGLWKGAASRHWCPLLLSVSFLPAVSSSCGPSLSRLLSLPVPSLQNWCSALWTHVERGHPRPKKRTASALSPHWDESPLKVAKRAGETPPSLFPHSLPGSPTRAWSSPSPSSGAGGGNTSSSASSVNPEGGHVLNAMPAAHSLPEVPEKAFPAPVLLFSLLSS